MKFCLLLALLAASTAAQQTHPPLFSSPTPPPQQPWTPPSFHAAQPPSPQQPFPQQPFPQQTSGGQARQAALTELCQTENGTMPFWPDNTCSKYLSCSSLNLTVNACDQGLAYSYPEHACVPTDQVNCTEQNEEFFAIIRAFIEPHFYQPLPRPRLPIVDATTPNGGQPEEEEEEVEEEEVDIDGLTIDLDSVPTISVDMTNALNITLPAELCVRLGGRESRLATSINTAILMMVGCPDLGCDVPLLRLFC